jgi:hypothetical protein
VIGLKLGRPIAGIYAKAAQTRISLSPPNPLSVLAPERVMTRGPAMQRLVRDEVRNHIPKGEPQQMEFRMDYAVQRQYDLSRDPASPPSASLDRAAASVGRRHPPAGQVGRNRSFRLPSEALFIEKVSNGRRRYLDHRIGEIEHAAGQ